MHFRKSREVPSSEAHEKTPLSFSEACLMRCPRVNAAVVGSIARQAFGHYDTVPPVKGGAKISSEEIRAAVYEEFKPREIIHNNGWTRVRPEGSLYVPQKDCAGPKVEQEGVGALTYGLDEGVAVLKCQRHDQFVIEGRIDDQDYIDTKARYGIE